MKLAERSTFLENRMWVCEIRKLSETGHQTAVISTNFVRDVQTTATAMFAKWSQEFFLNICANSLFFDVLPIIQWNNIPDTMEVASPIFREIDGEVQKHAAQLARKRCESDSIVLCYDIEPDKVGSV